MSTQKMKVEIWSDVTCTFCYTSKKRFESALSKFKDNDSVEVIWRSFELAPGFKTDPSKLFPQFLAELKGISIEHSKTMIDQVANSVNDTGLKLNLHQSIPANTFNAHRLSHFAKLSNLQNEIEEALFRAYFMEGKNIDDILILIQIASDNGLDASKVKNMFEGNMFTDEVRKDILEANESGITSVPFFRFNNSSTISGAQDTTLFLETLEKTFTQWESQIHLSNPENISGQSCSIDEECK